MATANETLRDLNLRHEIRIRRYSQSVLRKMLATLRRTDRSLTAQISERLAREQIAGQITETTARLEQVLNEVRGRMAAVSQELEGQLRGEMIDLGEFELDWQAKAINLASPIEFIVNRPPLEFIRAAAISRPFQGKLLAEHFRDMDAARFAQIRGLVRQAVIDGAAIPTLTRQLATLLDGNRRWAEAVGRTAINHIVTSARDELYQQNADIIKKWQFVATLDGRTTLTCISLDGTTWPLGKGPRPPRHINCRSTTIPITKSWEELGFDKALDDELAANAGKRPFVRDTRKVKDIPASERAQLVGQVPSHMNYGDWLKQQPPSFQDEVLGPTRARLFREGKLPVDRFTDDYGEVYRLDELRRREMAAFRRAGLGDDGRFRRFSNVQRFEINADPVSPLFEAPLTPGQVAALKATLTRHKGALARATDPAAIASLQQKIADVETRLGGARTVATPPAAPAATPPAPLSKGQAAAVKATIARFERELRETSDEAIRQRLQTRLVELRNRLNPVTPAQPRFPSRPADPLQDAGLTDYEIRRVLAGEAEQLGQRAREGWAFWGGDFQPVTPELVAQVRRFIEGEKDRLRRSLADWERRVAGKAESEVVQSVLSDGRGGVKSQLRAEFLRSIENRDELVRRFERQLARRPAEIVPKVTPEIEVLRARLDRLERDLASFSPLNRIPLYQEIDELRAQLGIKARATEFGEDELGRPMSRYTGVPDSAQAPNRWGAWTRAYDENSLLGLNRDTTDSFQYADNEWKLLIARLRQHAEATAPLRYDWSDRKLNEAYWSDGERLLKVPKASTGNWASLGYRWRAVAHEMTHWLDSEMGILRGGLARYSTRPGFLGKFGRAIRYQERGGTLTREIMAAMKADQDHLVQLFGGKAGFPAAERRLRAEITEIFREPDGSISDAGRTMAGQLWDWLGAVTNNELGAGHSLSYFENFTRVAEQALAGTADLRHAVIPTRFGKLGPGNVSEAFAQYGSTRAMYGRFPGLRPFIEKYLPNMLREFDARVSQAIQDAETALYGPP